MTEAEKKIQSLSERHGIAERESSLAVENLRNELQSAQQKISELSKVKHELEHRYESLQEDMSSLTRNLEDLARVKVISSN